MRGVTIRVLRTAPAANAGTPYGASTSTDANGYYAYKVVPGTYQVQAIEYGFVARTSPNVTVTATNMPRTMNLDLVAAPVASSVSGNVKDANTGQLVNGVTVRLWLYPAIFRYASAVTSGQGAWQLTNIPAGTYYLQYAAKGYPTQWYTNSTTETGGTAITITGGGGPYVLNAQIGANHTGSCS